MASITVEYEQTEGGRLSDSEFKIVQREIMTMARRAKGVTAQDVVDAARKKSSPLHRLFEWDDKKAAHEYRLEQARALIRKVKVRIVDDDPDKPLITRAVVHMRNDGAYHAVENVMTRDEMRQELLAQALREHEAWEKRWCSFSELADLFLAGDLKKKLFK